MMKAVIIFIDTFFNNMENMCEEVIYNDDNNHEKYIKNEEDYNNIVKLVGYMDLGEKK